VKRILVECGSALWLLVPLSIPFIGCVQHHFVSIQAPILAEGQLPEMDICRPVALKALGDGNDESVTICTSRGYRYNASMSDLTRTALAVAIEVMLRNHVVVAANADRQLSLVVVTVGCELGFWTMDYTARIRVRAGQPTEREFIGRESARSLRGTKWAVEHAIVNAVLSMFSDPSILEYLQCSRTRLDGG
jgi:hypothetical protein